MPEPVDVGLLIGSSAAAAQLDALREVPEARLLGLCGDDEAAVRRLARERNTQAFTSYGQMLGCDDLDLVVVASAGPLRGQHALRAIEAGKHVWLEPPMASSLEEAVRVRDAAGRAGVRVAVALAGRFHPRSQALRRAIAGGRIGSLALIRYSLRALASADGPPPAPAAAPRSALCADSMQAFDFVAFLADRLPARVLGLARPPVQVPPGAGPLAYLAVHLALDGGALGSVEILVGRGVGDALPPREDLLVVGTRGCLRAGTDHDTRVTLDGPGGSLGLGDGLPPTAALAEATRQMVRHVRGGPPPIPFGHSLRIFAASLAALRSAETGQPVALR
jgi:predicted dehydrogenase